MSHQTFICCICGEQTTKPKSYAIEGKGRACRTHQEAQEGRENTLKSEKAQMEARIERENKKFSSAFEGMENEPLFNFRNPRTYCWCCEKDGVMEDVFALRRMVLLEKHSIKDGQTPNIFDRSSPYWQELLAEFEGKKIIKFFQVDPTYPEWKLKQILPKSKNPWDGDKIQLVRFTQLMVLCLDCASNFEFNWDWDRIEFSDSTAALMVGSVVYSQISPGLKAMASQEIAKEEIDKASQRAQKA